VLSRSRTMATRMIGDFDERDTCRELARYSIITSLPKAREDQVASQIPAKRGTVALSKHWVPRASGRLAQARLRQ